MAEVLRILEFVEERTSLDVIAVTDHDEIVGSYQARELAAQLGYHFDVVTGIEVSTLEGHLLALYVESPVPGRQPLEQTIEAVHAQGGLCIVPHPMSWLTDSVSERSLKRIMASREQGLYLDGIETINSTVAGRVSGRKARRFNERHRLAETGGSDAHFLIAVGSGLTLFPGRSAEDLRRSLLQRTTRAANGARVRLSDVGLPQIIRQQFRSKGFPYVVRSMLRGLFRG